MRCKNKMDKKQNKISFKYEEYSGIFALAVLAGLAISFCNFSVLAVLASILFIIISFKYFNQVLIFLILYLPFQVALNITAGIDLASGRILILYLFAVWTIKSLAEKRFVVKFSLQTLLICLFLFIAVFSMLQAWDMERAFRKILVFLSIFPLYFIITSTVGTRQCLVPTVANNNSYISKILNALILSGFVLSLIGIIQFILQFLIGINPLIIFWSKYIAPLFYGNTFGAEVVANPSWLVNISGATILRAFSFFPDPHMFSFYLGLLIPIVLAIALVDCRSELVSESTGNKNLSRFQFLRQSIIKIGKNSGYKQKILKQAQNDNLVQNDKYIFFNNKLLYFILFAMLLAELFTFSRGGYLGMIAGIGVVIILLWRQITFNKKIVLGLISAVAIVFLLTTSQSILNRFLSSFNFNEGSNTERLKNWDQGWNIFNDNLLTGVGIGNYSLAVSPIIEYRTPVYAHNLYLDLGAEMGIFVLVVWLLLIGITIWQLLKTSKNSDNQFLQVVSIGLIGSLVWFSVHSFFDTPIYSPTILAIFVVIISLATIINSPFNKGG